MRLWLAAVFSLLCGLSAWCQERTVALNLEWGQPIQIKGTEKIWMHYAAHKGKSNVTLITKGAQDENWWSPSMAVIVASREMRDGRWSSIRPLLLEPLKIKDSFKIGHALVGTLKASEPVRYKITVEELSPVLFEAIANRLGSKMDPCIRVLDDKGGEIAFNDDDLAAARDCRLVFTPPKKGAYTLELSDMSNASGDDVFFCLRSKQWESNDTRKDFYTFWSRDSGVDLLKRQVPLLSGIRIYTPGPRPKTIPASVSEGFSNKPDVYEFDVHANQKLIMRARTREIGEPCDARLALFGQIKKPIAESVGAGAEAASITNRFEKAGTYHLEVSEISKLSGKYWITIEEARPGVILETEIEKTEFSKEGEAKIKIQARRFDYEGPISVVAEGLPEGVELLEATIPEKKSEHEVKLKSKGKIEALNIRLHGRIEGKNAKSDEERFPVSTMPALKKLFPLQMFPSPAMDGWIAVNPN